MNRPRKRLVLIEGGRILFLRDMGGESQHALRPNSVGHDNGLRLEFRIMKDKSKVVAYTRNPRTRNEVSPYESKFAEWIKVIAHANTTNADAILIAEPWVIGDTYEEIIESLLRLGGTGVALQIARQKNRVEDN